MKKIIFLLAIPVVLLLVGCQTPQNRPTYVWQNYSSSLYTLKKTPSDANLKNHKDVLLTIMDESKKENCRVPPGVYCEYGYLLLKEGKTEEAFQYFDLEAKTYPESAVFVQNLKTYATKRVKKDEDESKLDNNAEKQSNKDVGDSTVGTETAAGSDKAPNTDTK